MSKHAVLDDWEIGKFFGVLVVRGYVGDRHITAMLRWWSQGRFGVSSGHVWVEDILAVGRPAATAFEGLNDESGG